MTDDLEQLLAKALELPPEARAALAGQLLESIDDYTPYEEASEDEWNELIRNRIEQIDSGSVKTISWDETERKLQAIVDAAKNR